VPPQYFRDIEVLEGGFGAGTRTRFQAHVLGTIQEVRHVVTEPVPGRVLVESDVDKASTTTFKVEPSGTDAATLLTITTDLAGRDGLAGMVERWLTSLMLRRIYRKELALITEYAPTADL
jgi:hypothetical protein